MGIAKDSISENKLKNSIFLEKYDYLIGFCFPYGTENDISLCSKSDYEELIKLIYSFFNDVNSTNFDALILRKEELEVNKNDYALFSLNAFNISIPLIIYIFFTLYDKINSKKLHRSNFYKIFISYFKFLKNSGELFNFSINISNFNNYNGITYIKGILGISIL